MDHVVIRKLEHLTGSRRAPSVDFAVEMRERPGPAHKNGAFPDDVVWVQLRGGLLVAKARVSLCWIGEYSSVAEIRTRTRGSQLHDLAPFWAGRPRYGYAALARLEQETWIDPTWAGARTYGYEWVLLEDAKKRSSWLDPRPPPRSREDLAGAFREWLGRAGAG
ncbi:MAG: hypothetical protein M3P18_13800 [Actinomycetota bacterium]|nr:hypothetical protein [Actinomycetota bacterium]